jgi:hypothetical protein
MALLMEAKISLFKIYRQRIIMSFFTIFLKKDSNISERHQRSVLSLKWLISSQVSIHSSGKFDINLTNTAKSTDMIIQH